MEIVFPNEIWEHILVNLPLRELLTASCVCRQWRHLVRRLCRRRCQGLPPRLLEELIHEHCTARGGPAGKDSWRRNEEEPNWLDVGRMLIQTQVTSRAEDCCVVSQLSQVIHLAAAEKFVVVVTRNEEEQQSCTLSLVLGSGRVTCQYLVHGKVNKVCVLEGGGRPSVLCVSVNKELLGLLVQPQSRALVPITVSPTLAVDSRLCCDGQTLVVSQLEEDYHLSVYRATLLSGLELALQCRIRTTSPPVCWDLWNGFVTTMMPSGHIHAYTLSGALVAESPLYKDLRYPNPTLLSRGLVLTSTITSRTLLSYWHMDRDRDYWLVGESVLTSWVQRGANAVGNTSPHSVVQPGGRPGDSASRGLQKCFESGSSCVVTLAKVRLGAAVLLEVTVVYYQRGLVFCGTRQGYLLVYKILEGWWGREAGLKWEVLETCMPSLCLSLSRRPLARIAACFVDAIVMVTVGDRDGNCHIVSIPTSLAST